MSAPPVARVSRTRCASETSTRAADGATATVTQRWTSRYHSPRAAYVSRALAAATLGSIPCASRSATDYRSVGRRRPHRGRHRTTRSISLGKNRWQGAAAPTEVDTRLRDCQRRDPELRVVSLLRAVHRALRAPAGPRRGSGRRAQREQFVVRFRFHRRCHCAPKLSDLAPVRRVD